MCVDVWDVCVFVFFCLFMCEMSVCVCVCVCVRLLWHPWKWHLLWSGARENDICFCRRRWRCRLFFALFAACGTHPLTVITVHALGSIRSICCCSVWDCCGTQLVVFRRSIVVVGRPWTWHLFLSSLLALSHLWKRRRLWSRFVWHVAGVVEIPSMLIQIVVPSAGCQGLCCCPSMATGSICWTEMGKSNHKMCGPIALRNSGVTSRCTTPRLLCFDCFHECRVIQNTKPVVWYTQ